MTAGHCARDAGWKLTIDDQVVKVLARSDEDVDLAVIQGPARPRLKWRSYPARRGEVMLSVGHALALEQFVVGLALAAHPYLIVFDDQLTPKATFYGNAIPGMSGGPIVDSRYRVSSVVQAGGYASEILQDIMCGAEFIELYKFTRDYWDY